MQDLQPCLISLWQTNIVFAHPGALGDRVTGAGNKVTRAKKSHGNLNLRLVTHSHCNREFRGGLEHFSKLTGKKNISKGKIFPVCLSSWENHSTPSGKKSIKKAGSLSELKQHLCS